jgi:hypothetical protein
MPGVVVTLTHGTRRYSALLDQIREDADLVVAMWRDGEHLPLELDVPGTQWSIALVDGVPAAWCAATVTDGVLTCHSNYERPGHRGHGLYRLAYRERHRTVIAPAGLDAVTYLFADPIELHQADGWTLTGREGSGVLPDHHWYELRRSGGEQHAQ